VRAVAVACLLTAPMLAFGWPSPWLLLAGSFAAGFVARRPLTDGPGPRRGGYLLPPASGNGNQGTAERVATYTGFSTGGQSAAATGALTTRAEPNSSTDPGGSTVGRDVPSGMDGYLGRSLAAGAGSDSYRRYIAYTRRLNDAQRLILEGLREDTLRNGALPGYALEVMAPYGPWPDPYDDGGPDA
jgi:hypothetical protein